VLEERRSIDDLSDAEVDGLRYLLSGAWRGFKGRS